MEVTEVRVKLVDIPSERLKAFCTLTLDGEFVIRDLKIIDGPHGPFVAMPSRKLTDRCGKCGSKNHLRAHFCNECGAKLGEHRAGKDDHGRTKLHADVAHPIHAACRQKLQDAVLTAYGTEVERSKQPGYVPTRLGDDYDEEQAQAGHRRSDAPPKAKPSAPTPEPPSPSEKKQEGKEGGFGAGILD